MYAHEERSFDQQKILENFFKKHTLEKNKKFLVYL